MGVLKRFVVAEDSMRPALEPGDRLLGCRTRRVRRAELRCFEHPHRPGFWLVKRVGHIRGRAFEACSDNADVVGVDSRSFGDVTIEGSYRVIVRLPRRGATFR